MDAQSVAAVILAAGEGARMKSATPKVLHRIGGRPMLAHVLQSAAGLDAKRVCVVVGEGAAAVEAAAREVRQDAAICIQAPPRGTGDAVAKALPALEGFDGLVVILYADTPMIEPATLKALAEAAAGRAGAVLGFRAFDPGDYGRLIVDGEGRLQAIVEARDATAEELDTDFCNSGVMAVDAGFLRRALPQLTADNAKNEFYLTDIVAVARAEGAAFAVVEGDEEEMLGVNSRIELAIAEEIFQHRRRIEVMDEGATLIDPSSVYFSFDTAVGRDVVIEPNVIFGPGVKVADGAQIRGFSHIEGATIASGAIVGPFARLRPGAQIGEAARVGNFVEVKAADIGAGAKANHLAYIGDATVGARANIGAGTITCNYDGYRKYRTKIGEEAFIGSNSALVAPVEVGARAYIGSGSVITRNVDEDALAVARGRQADIKGWAARFRQAGAAERNKDEDED